MTFDLQSLLTFAAGLGVGSIFSYLVKHLIAEKITLKNERRCNLVIKN